MNRVAPPRRSETRIRLQRWRDWKWGWIAVLLAVLAWLGMFCLIVLGSLEYRPPGDGGSGLPGLQIYLWGALVSVLSLAFGCVAASLLAWRLRRGRTGAVIAAGLLLLLAVVLLVPSLTERKLRVGDVAEARSPFGMPSASRDNRTA